ncbi:hypothetical protein [Nonomuraea typhae]|uniref:DNA alkylation repair protein n=1 Tax=Nonomuraea typhae TaxID=2603600 RepID=A0ABW7YUA7_9ACTN
MGQPLKEFVNADSVGVLADGLAAALPGFARERFVADSVGGLAAMELKDRVRHVARTLGGVLGVPFAEAAAALRACAPGLDMWSGWPATDYVALHGLDHLEVAMETLAALTPHATAEFAVRPYLERHGMAALDIMRGWAGSPDAHLRRLASEGSRPRLPWATRVGWLMTPGPTLPILARLRDDPSEYVRRSVANHVNDLAKDHPEAAVALLAGWRAEGGSHVEKVVRHAVRGLLRAGHPDALGLVGATPGGGRVTALTLAADQVAVGGKLTFTVDLVAAEPGPLVLRYAVVRPGSRRVFHLGERTAAGADEAIAVTKSHSFRPVTTRVEPPGPRTLEIVVNGVVRATAAFRLTEVELV